MYAISIAATLLTLAGLELLSLIFKSIGMKKFRDNLFHFQ